MFVVETRIHQQFHVVVNPDKQKKSNSHRLLTATAPTRVP